MGLHDFVIGLVVVVIWGLNFIVIKIGLRDIPPLLLGSLRFLAACLPVIFFLPRPPVAWRWLIALGLSINVGQFGFLFLAMKFGMPAGLASLVLQSQVFFTLAIAVVIRGERWHWNHVVGLSLAACGIAIIGFQQGGNLTAIGFWFTLAAAASWGIGNNIMRKATQDASSFSTLALIVWASAIAFLPLLVLSWCIEGSAAWQAAWYSFTWTTAASIIYLAYFATLCGFGLWGKLLSRLPAAVVSPLSLLVPVVGMSGSRFFLKEYLSFWQIIGALLVMAGLLIHVFGKKLTTIKSDLPTIFGSRKQRGYQKHQL
jgi:O-acetylserine/cysteine efflux transporter